MRGNIWTGETMLNQLTIHCEILAFALAAGRR